MRIRTAGTAVAILAVVTIASTISFSQSGAGVQDAGNRLSITYSLTPNPLVKITNNYSSPLTAMVVTVSSTGSRTEL